MVADFRSGRHAGEMEAVPLGEAAARLGVSRQWVGQLLAKGVLAGPRHPPGQRAPHNAPRVYLDSLEAEVERRAAQAVRSSGSTRGAGQASEAAFEDDAFRLKLALDVARDVIAGQRRQNERLTSLLADAVAGLQQEQALARETEQITEAYATIVTTHLGPDQLPEQP